MATVQTIADDLGVDVGDVRVVAAYLAARPVVDDALDGELSSAVRDVLDPNGERTASTRRFAGRLALRVAGMRRRGDRR